MNFVNLGLLNLSIKQYSFELLEMNAEKFGSLPNGQVVYRVILSGYGLEVSILSYGAIIQDLRLKGHNYSLVLGFDKLEDYLKHSPYFGAIAGRCANRIKNGQAELDGNLFELDRNYLKKHCLHGGSESMGKSLWYIEKSDDLSATLHIEVPDGHMGFPGNLSAKVTYSLMPSGILDINIEALSDRTTLCNLAPHSYFNLNGKGTILEHRLKILADHYNPVDNELIPTGEIKPIENTNFDFRIEKFIEDSGNSCENKDSNKYLDHNFCISREIVPLRQIASLSSPDSGVYLKLKSTQPGLQIYTGSKIDCPVTGHDNFKMGTNSGIAMEPQIWPDSINQPLFPQAVLRLGEKYNHQTQYILGMNN